MRAGPFFILGFIFLPLFASAHATLLGGLDAVVAEDRIDITISMPEERTLSDRKLFETYTKENFLFANNGEACAVSVDDFVTGNIRTAKPTTITLSVLCGRPIEELSVSSTYFANEGFVFSSTFEKDGSIEQFVFSDENTEAVFDWKEGNGRGVPPLSQAIIEFVKEGVRHIWFGYDHVLFILALLLGVSNLRRLVAIVTAFTIAHTITLALSALDLMSVAPIIVEPLIALSIAYVAFEKQLFALLQKFSTKIKTKTVSHRWKIAFGFGLVHGLGFAGVFREINIPDSVFIPSLLSFNIGVEVGQLTIVAAMFPLLYFIRNVAWQPRVLTVLSVLVGLIGLWWFIERVFI